MQLFYIISIWLFVHCCKTLSIEASKFKDADDKTEDTDNLSYQEHMSIAKMFKSPFNLRIRQPFPDLTLRNRFEDDNGDQLNTPKEEEVVIPLKSEFIESYSLTNRPVTDKKMFMGQLPTKMDKNTNEVLENSGSAVDGPNVSDYENHPEPLDEDLNNVTANAIDEPTLNMVSLPKPLDVQSNTTMQIDDIQEVYANHSKGMKLPVSPYDSAISKSPNHNFKPGQIDRSNPYSVIITEFPFTANVNQLIPATIPVRITPLMPHGNLNNFKFFSNRTKTTKTNTCQNRTTKKDSDQHIGAISCRLRSNGTIIKAERINQSFKSNNTKNVSHEPAKNVFTLESRDHDLTAMSNDFLNGGQDHRYATLFLVPQIMNEGRNMNNVSAYDRYTSNNLIRLGPSKRLTTQRYTVSRNNEIFDKENFSLTGNRNDRKFKIKPNVYNGSHNIPINRQGTFNVQNKDFLSSLTNYSINTFDRTGLPNVKDENNPLKKKVQQELSRQKWSQNSTRSKLISGKLNSKQTTEMDFPGMMWDRDQLNGNSSSFTQADRSPCRCQNNRLPKEDTNAKVLEKLDKISQQALITSNKILNSTLKKFIDESFKDAGLFSPRQHSLRDTLSLANYTLMPPLECRSNPNPNSTSATIPTESPLPNFKFWKTIRIPSTDKSPLPKACQNDTACQPPKMKENACPINYTSADQKATSVTIMKSWNVINSPGDKSCMILKGPENISQVSTCSTVASSKSAECANIKCSTNDCTEVTKCCGVEAETDIQTPMPMNVISLSTTMVTERGEPTECSTLKSPDKRANIETNSRMSDDNSNNDHKIANVTGKTMNAVIKKPSHIKVVKVIGKDQYISKVINALKAGPVSELLVNLDVDDSVNVNGTLKCKYLNKRKQ